MNARPLRRIVAVTVTTLAVWVLTGLGAAHAEARTVTDGPPVLEGADAVKVAACAVAAAIGLVLCLWSLRPERPAQRVRVRARDDGPSR